jgi:hypothetical protein
MCFSTPGEIPSALRVPGSAESEVDRDEGSASPDFGVAGAGLPSLLDFGTPSSRATESSPRRPPKRAQQARNEPHGFVSPSALISSTPAVGETFASAASSVDATPNADAQNASLAETPSVSAAPSVAAVAALAAREVEIDAPRAFETPAPAPFARLARAAQVGRYHERRRLGGRRVEPPDACQTFERELDTPKFRPVTLPGVAGSNVIRGVGSALNALAVSIARPGG